MRQTSKTNRKKIASTVQKFFNKVTNDPSVRHETSQVMLAIRSAISAEKDNLPREMCEPDPERIRLARQGNSSEDQVEAIYQYFAAQSPPRGEEKLLEATLQFLGNNSDAQVLIDKMLADKVKKPEKLATQPPSSRLENHRKRQNSRITLLGYLSFGLVLAGAILLMLIIRYPQFIESFLMLFADNDQANNTTDPMNAETRLITAVLSDDVPTALELIAGGEGLNLIHRNHTLLELAVVSEGAEIVEAVVNKYPQLVQAVDNQIESSPVIHQAVATGRSGIVNTLLRGGANPNQIDNTTNHTPLVQAIILNNTAIVQLLISNGAVLNQVSGKTQQAPIYHAVFGGHHQVVDRLLKAGADANLMTPEHLSLLHLSVIRKDPQSAHQLVAAGADPNVVNLDGATPLMFAIMTTPIQPSMVRILVEAGTNVTQAMDGGVTPLHYATAVRQYRAAEYLLKNNAVVDQVSRGAHTSLMQATLHNFSNMVNLLIRWGADPTHINDAGKTPRGIAKIKGFLSIAELLRKAEIIETNWPQTCKP